MRYYIKILFPITLFVLILAASCTKEQDVTTVEVEVEEPQPGETLILRGTVRDTAELAIGKAVLRVRRGNFDKEITADENGFYEIELPASQEKGLIIAAKAQYNRTIQSIDLGSGEATRNIYLLENPDVQTIDLEVNINSLFTLRGRIVDQYGAPVPDLFVLGESLHEGGDEVKYSGQTDADGFFEFIEEQKEYQIHLIVSGRFEAPCFDRLIEFLPHVNDTLLDMGNIVFPLSATREITPTITITDCSEIEYINHIYNPGDFNIIQEQITAGQSYTICDTSLTGSWMYNGVMSIDKQNFNGQFQSINDFSDTQSFSLCTPAGSFAEIRSASGILLDLDPVYDDAAKTITVADGSDSITFRWQGSFGYSGRNSYTYSNIGAFKKTDANQNIIYQLSDSSRSLVNWVTPQAGVLTVNVVFPDGDTDLITVRFRL